MERHKDLECKGVEHLKSSCTEEVTQKLWWSWIQISQDVIRIPIHVRRPSGLINIVKQQIGLPLPDSGPTHFVSYRAGLQARVFHQNKTNKILRINFIDSTQTEWAAPVLFASSNYKAVHFCVHYRTLILSSWEIISNLKHIRMYRLTWHRSSIFDSGPEFRMISKWNETKKMEIRKHSLRIMQTPALSASYFGLEYP